ncbi:transposase [Acinetobacter johnsonii]|uniref:Transposase n=1 Tax=Acinetobacter johnsonii TaxID=40214 RepID=A0AA42XDU1_ACIJO|nr:transposase [Acinetobacter johnsonii]MDH2171083.1 transposase [Acinetobacter johnsonii]MDH2174343.1 transposase [Acinetobacter johnsonii]QPF34368.1 transposase [Acinetobacter johnsonii]
MKQKFSVAKINSIVKKNLAGATIEQICEEYKISVATFYRWKASYIDINEQILIRLDRLEQENLALKQMYAEERLSKRLEM